MQIKILLMLCLFQFAIEIFQKLAQKKKGAQVCLKLNNT